MQVKPDGTVSVRVTVPVKPLRPVRVMSCVPATLTVVLTVTGDDGAMVKSVTWKRIDAVVCDSVPSVPVTVTE